MSESPRGGINVATVLASGGVAAIVSAVLVTIAVVGMNINDNDSPQAVTAQPTVVNLGAAQPQAPVAASAAPTTAAPTSDAAETPAAETPAAAAPPAAEQPAAPAAPTAAPTTTTSAAAPQALSAGQLKSKVDLLLGSGSNAAKADELESGATAVSATNQVGGLVRAAGPIFSYRVTNPSLSGDKLNATLVMAVVGMGERTLPLQWVWKDGKWKLSDKSVCVVAEYAQLKCPV